jgi:hypothetical protein
MPTFQRTEASYTKQFILQVFMYGFETWYVTLMKELKLQVSGNEGK